MEALRPDPVLARDGLAHRQAVARNTWRGALCLNEKRRYRPHQRWLRAWKRCQSRRHGCEVVTDLISVNEGFAGVRGRHGENLAACRATRCDARWCVLDDDALRGRDSELRAGAQVTLRSGLPAPDVLTEHAHRRQRETEPYEPLGCHRATA